MRKFLFLSLLVLLLCGCSLGHLSKQPDRVLFVGNSLTYVGNLPAVFAALARANGHPTTSYMVVAPGGTLSERVADGSAASGLRKCGCNIMILQERGGDLFGLFGHDALMKSKKAIRTLAKLGRANGAKVVLLGTYNSRNIAHRLTVEEDAAAQNAGIPYVAVGEWLWRLHDAYPSLQWLRRKEGGHPGKALTLLDAVLVYKQLYGRYPAAKGFVVHAPIYGVHTGLKPEFRKADAPAPHAGTAPKVSYSASMIEKLLQSLKSGTANNSLQRTALTGRR